MFEGRITLTLRHASRRAASIGLGIARRVPRTCPVIRSASCAWLCASDLARNVKLTQGVIESRIAVDNLEGERWNSDLELVADAAPDRAIPVATSVQSAFTPPLA